MKLADILNRNLVLEETQIAADNELVKQIQTRLAELNYYPKQKIDGVYGPLTRGAIVNFCTARHLNNAVNGRYGATFARALIEADPPREPQTKEEHIQLIINECHKQGISDPRSLSYILATVQHETDGKYQPIDEYASGAQYEGRRDLGNFSPGDGKRYKGRGFVQLTGKANYATYSHLVGRDLLTHPELAKDPAIAAFILVHGFKTGGFTGRKISDYINDKHCDFHNCRRCINGTDRAELIAGYANKWLQKLK